MNESLTRWVENSHSGCSVIRSNWGGVGTATPASSWLSTHTHSQDQWLQQLLRESMAKTLSVHVGMIGRHRQKINHVHQEILSNLHLLELVWAKANSQSLHTSSLVLTCCTRRFYNTQRRERRWGWVDTDRIFLLGGGDCIYKVRSFAIGASSLKGVKSQWSLTVTCQSNLMYWLTALSHFPSFIII